MKFTLYLELATREQGENLIDLVRFPTVAESSTSEWIARWWSRGKTRRMRSTNREQILQQLQSEGLNEIDLQWSSVESWRGRPLQAVDLSIFFSPSRTSSIWAPVPSQKLERRDDERQRKSFGGGESPPNEGYRLPRPSVAEFSITLECAGNFNDPELQEQSVDWIQQALLHLFRLPDCFGYGCLHGDCRTMNMLVSLGGVPSWTDRLGERFENIYPILIGPLASCRGLASVAGRRCRLVEISEESPNAIVSISPGDIQALREEVSVKDWVVIRDLREVGFAPEELDDAYEKEIMRPDVAPFVKR